MSDKTKISGSMIAHCGSFRKGRRMQAERLAQVFAAMAKSCREGQDNASRDGIDRDLDEARANALEAAVEVCRIEQGIMDGRFKAVRVPSEDGGWKRMWAAYNTHERDSVVKGEKPAKPGPVRHVIFTGCGIIGL